MCDFLQAEANVFLNNTQVPPAGLEEAINQGPKKKHDNNITIKNFSVIKLIGKGSFGKVLLVRKNDTGEIYAMKSLAKETLRKRNQVEHTKTERSVLEKVKNPFIVSLHYAFQTVFIYIYLE